MVLHHVAQTRRTCRNSRPRPSTPSVSAHGDLHVIDVTVIPERLENRVGEAQHHDVLRGLLAEVVVDAVGVLLGEGSFDHLIEPLRAGQVGAEWLLDDDARPTA